MPNHIKNIVSIKAENVAKMEEIRKAIGSSDTCFFDFNKIIPMPEELKNTSSPANIVSEEEYPKKVEEYERDKGDKSKYVTRSITQAMSDDYMKRFGADTWYEWSVKNWGTKWDAYDQEMNGDIYEFQTAWSTPTPIFIALSKMFPDAEITVEYADEDMGSNCGVMEFKGGECEEDDDMSEHANDRVSALKFACKVWDQDYSDSYDEEGNYIEE